MKKVWRIFFLIIIILALISGCSKKEPNPNEPPQQDQVDKKPDNDSNNGSNDNSNVGNENPPGPIDTPIRSSFKEAFPDEVFNTPQAYLQTIVPGFKIGLLQKDVENKLGIPESKLKSQNDWEERVDWTYNNVKGYTLITSFNSDGYLINFKLLKDLDGKGIIPKITNKPVPVNGAGITYNELGFEGVLIGSDVKEVLDNYGDPVQGYLTYDEMYGYNLVLVYRGLNLYVALEKDSPYVQLIETNSLGKVATYREVEIGTSVEKIIEKYGSPSYENWQDMGEIIYPTEDLWYAIKFHIDNNRISNISIYEAF